MKLTLEHIHHAFGGNALLQNCSYIFVGGKIYSIQGSNGTGKTTLLNILNGYIKPMSGSVILNEHYYISNQSVSNTHKKGILRLWQQGEVFKNLSVLDNLMVAVRHEGESLTNYIFGYKRIRKQEEILKNKAEEVLKLIGLLDDKETLVKKLSFGQQRLVAFSRLLMDSRINTGNTIILLDEPFSGIHSELINTISQKIKEFAHLGNIVIMIEHNYDRLNKIADFKLEINGNTLKELINE